MTSEKKESNQKQAPPSAEEELPDKLKKLLKALKARDFRARNDAIKELGRRKEPQARQKLMEIAESSNWNPHLRVSALDALGRGKKNENLEKLLQKIARDKTQKKELRRAALTQLSKFRDPETIKTFIQALDDDYRFIRFWAVRGLIKIDDPKATAALIQALGDPNEEIRKEVRTHLETISKDVIPPLIKAYKEADSNDFLRYGVLGILGRIRDPRAYELMLNAIKDKNHRVVTIALRGLGKMQNPDAIPDLLDLYRKNKAKRRQIQNTLYRIGRESQKIITLYLASLLIEDEPAMRQLAVTMYKKFANSYLYLGDLADDPDLKQEVKEEIKKVMNEL